LSIKGQLQRIGPVDLCPCTAKVLPGNAESIAIEGAEKGAEIAQRLRGGIGKQKPTFHITNPGSARTLGIYHHPSKPLIDIGGVGYRPLDKCGVSLPSS
jgi:hypothetical protein